jgi:hypothetical protein
MNPHFAAFMQEGLTWIDTWTPTEINNGGCGVFAGLLSDKLTELNIEHKILVLYFHDKPDAGRKNFKEYMSNHSEKNLKKAGEDHIVLYITELELYVDSQGIRNPMCLSVDERVEISRDVLQKLIDEGNWNDTFDRGCIPFISTKLDEMFKHIDTFDSGCFKYPGKNDVKYTQYTIKHRHLSLPNFLMQ